MSYFSLIQVLARPDLALLRRSDEIGHIQGNYFSKEQCFFFLHKENHSLKMSICRDWHARMTYKFVKSYIFIKKKKISICLSSACAHTVPSG
jgi:homoserine trans-succinylase